jgi:hypothetical protein
MATSTPDDPPTPDAQPAPRDGTPPPIATGPAPDQAAHPGAPERSRPAAVPPRRPAPPPRTGPPWWRPRSWWQLVVVGVVGLLLGCVLGAGITAVAAAALHGRPDMHHSRYDHRRPDNHQRPGRPGPRPPVGPMQPQPSPQVS